jgi:hypothetical protein
MSSLKLAALGTGDRAGRAGHPCRQPAEIDAHIDAERSADEDGDDGLAGALVPAG